MQKESYEHLVLKLAQAEHAEQRLRKELALMRGERDEAYSMLKGMLRAIKFAENLLVQEQEN